VQNDSNQVLLDLRPMLDYRAGGLGKGKGKGVGPGRLNMPDEFVPRLSLSSSAGARVDRLCGVAWRCSANVSNLNAEEELNLGHGLDFGLTFGFADVRLPLSVPPPLPIINAELLDHIVSLLALGRVRRRSESRVLTLRRTASTLDLLGSKRGHR
jgi:hypothetical protein